MTDTSRPKFPALSVLLGLSGWIGLYFSNHAGFISAVSAASAR